MLMLSDIRHTRAFAKAAVAAVIATVAAAASVAAATV